MVFQNLAIQVLGVFQQFTENLVELYRVVPLLDYHDYDLGPLLPNVFNHWSLGNSPRQSRLCHWLQERSSVQTCWSLDYDGLEPHADYPVFYFSRALSLK